MWGWNMVEGAALTLTYSELAMCFVFGVIGGFVLDLFTYRGGIEFPRKRLEKETAPGIVSGKLVTFLDLGFIADMIIGGVAAIVVLRFVSPTDSIQLATTSLVAGLGGSGIIGASVNRLKAEIAEEQVRTEEQRTGKVAANTKALLTKILAQRGVGVSLRPDLKIEISNDLMTEVSNNLSELEQYLA